MWCTGTQGTRRAKAVARDQVTPTRSAPISPGAAAAAIAAKVPPLDARLAQAAATTGSMRLRWSRAASSGTTPP